VVLREARMPESKTADAVKLVLRLPKSLHKRLRQQAARNNVSLNTEIVTQLEGAEAAAEKRMLTVIKKSLHSSASTDDLQKLLRRLADEQTKLRSAMELRFMQADAVKDE
jgi:uncharacterized membrane protein YheB (UPF0754 family)